MTMEPINMDELPEFDSADLLKSEEAIAAFLADAQQDGPAEVAKCMVTVERARKRWGLPKTGITIGLMAGQIHMSDDFDAPLSDDELRALEGLLPPS